MAFLKALIFITVAVLAVLFALANRGAVTVVLDPFSRDAPAFALSLPLFALVFGAVMVGVLLGGIATWFSQGKHRKAARENRREAQKLRGETDTLRRDAEALRSTEMTRTSYAPAAGLALSPPVPGTAR